MTFHILKVSLADIRPVISRRLRVPSEYTLADLHDVLQVAFGWEDCHLHEFRIDGATFGVPHPDDDRELVDEKSVILDEVLPRQRAKAEYTYDFGDGWTHTIRVERREPEVPARGSHMDSIAAPLTCLEAKRACPPEDCGGPYGYPEFLRALKDPGHERHAELTAWIGGAFDPEHVPLAQINQRLAAFGR